MTTYLITQASGQQSGWVIRHLLAAGHKIHAVVRNPATAPAILKNNPAITVFQGDSTDSSAILAAAQGCKGAFLNTFPIPGLETQQARTIVEACKKAGVESLVAATTFGVNDKSLWDDDETESVGLRGYFSSKAEVESIVRAAGFKSYTILRPGFIHHDYFLPSSVHNYPELSTTGELVHAYEAGATMPHSDAHDVGAYAAAAFQDPDKFNGAEINIGFESLTIEDMQNILVKVSGREVRVRKRTPEEVEALRETFLTQRFQLWASTRDLAKTLVGVKEAQDKFGIEFTSVEDALMRDRERVLKTIPE